MSPTEKKGKKGEKEKERKKSKDMKNRKEHMISKLSKSKVKYTKYTEKNSKEKTVTEAHIHELRSSGVSSVTCNSTNTMANKAPWKHTCSNSKSMK